MLCSTIDKLRQLPAIGRHVGLAWLVFAALIPSTCWAVNIDQGFQNTAADQPKVNVALSLNGTTALISPDGVDPNNPLHTVPTINFQAFFDTGTSGILLSKETAQSFGIQTLKVGAVDIVFSDIAVGGEATFNVSQAMYVNLAPINSSVNAETFSNYTQQFGPLNAQVSQNFAGLFSEPVDVIGTPAMAGKVVVIDSRDLNSAVSQAKAGNLVAFFNGPTLKTYVYNPGTSFLNQSDNPGIPPATFHVQLSKPSFSRFTSVAPSGAQGPALSTNPFIGPNPVSQLDDNPPIDPTPKLKISYNNFSAEGSFLFDSGAQFSMISNAMAQLLHISHLNSSDLSSPLRFTDPSDPLNPHTIPDQFTVQVAGVDGNALSRPGFYLDSLLMHTLEATTGLDGDPNNLNFLHVPVLVSDITSHDPTAPVGHQDITLDGLIGMNLLTSSFDADSLLGLIFGTVNPADVLATGAFDYVVYDQVNGTLNLTLTGAVPEPSSGILGGLAALFAAVAWRRKMRKMASHV